MIIQQPLTGVHKNKKRRGRGENERNGYRQLVFVPYFKGKDEDEYKRLLTLLFSNCGIVPNCKYDCFSLSIVHICATPISPIEYIPLIHIHADYSKRTSK